MNEYSCDSCSNKIPEGELRYIAEIKLYAAPEMVITKEDFKKDFRKEMERLVEETKNMSEEELLAEVYIFYRLNLCKKCRDIFVKRISHKEFV